MSMPKSERLVRKDAPRKLDSMSSAELGKEIDSLRDEIFPEIAGGTEQSRPLRKPQRKERGISPRTDMLTSSGGEKGEELVLKTLRYNRAIEIYQGRISQLQKVKKLRDAEE